MLVIPLWRRERGWKKAALFKAIVVTSVSLSSQNLSLGIYQMFDFLVAFEQNN